ncbi:MAG TPA: HAMP domain-containing sensor histidine kinase [Bryobacteraceae bacterium]|nr:HAMP domain-containing sensor histidine kinase [Bryobacteraceae bacterium]
MNRRRALFSWLVVGALILLLGVLGFLQYRWIGEVSVAARERLKGSLQVSLNRLSQDFNSEITAACRALWPNEPPDDPEAVEAEIASRFEQWKQSHPHASIFSKVAIASAHADRLTLRRLDPDTGLFSTTEWPSDWASTRDRLESRMLREPWMGRRPPDPPQDAGRDLIELPLFAMRSPGAAGPPFAMTPRGGRFADFRRREAAWLLLDVNVAYVRETLLPELLQRYLAGGQEVDYQSEVLSRSNPPVVIFRSDPNQTQPMGKRADASVGLFEIQYEQFFRRRLPQGMMGRGGPGGAPGPRLIEAGLGRWQLFVRHRAGSLDAVVARARMRNLVVTGCVLLLMLASVGALMQFTRRAQRLAELQMDFVAGVSHELRTPLTVIHTAAYNLRGKVAASPAQVERYGALIQKESGRLKDLVEQVLRFAGANAGHIVNESEPVSIESLIDETMEESRQLLEGRVVEKTVEAGLPPVPGDRVALKQVLQNLISNAAKYGGAEGNNWIGVFASRASGKGQPMIEIRVADRGPGIPQDEQELLFDPFFRGRRALQDQVHGTGLGLNLVKKIVEAHGGTVRVKSELEKGAEFIVRIPVASTEAKS